MRTSPKKARTVETAVGVNKQQELEIRLALHEFYAMQLPLNERKNERMREYMAQLQSPEVDLATLMSNSLLDEDCLDWLTKDADLYVMSITRRPKWVSKFE